MNDNILKLIDLVTKLTADSNRDLHYEITLDYNGGKPLWFLHHDGKIWQMEQYVPPSRNGFRTFTQAEAVLTETLVKVAGDALAAQKKLPENERLADLTELEIQYLILEIAS